MLKVFVEILSSNIIGGRVIPIRDPIEGDTFKRVMKNAHFLWYLNFCTANSN